MDKAVLPTFSSWSDSLSDETGVEEEEGNLKEKKTRKEKIHLVWFSIQST